MNPTVSKLLKKIKHQSSELVILNRFLETTSEGITGHILKQVITGLVLEHYHQTHMVDKKIDISTDVKKDINKCLQNKKIDALTKEESLLVMNCLIQKWTHPDNIVRNKMKLFIVRSPKILTPILEEEQ